MNPDHDIIIVGARVAGSVLATLLGQIGYSVLLIDRATFPSDTLSTHFFRWPTFAMFERIGVQQEVAQCAPGLISNYNAIDGHVFSEPVSGPDGPSYHLCVRRITLDHILARRVRQEPSVSTLEGTPVTDLVRRDQTVIGVRWKEHGAVREATARAVVGADGVNSFVAKNVEVRTKRDVPVQRAMYYAYYRDLEAQDGPSAEFHYQGNHLAYVFPTDGGLTLLAASIPIDEFPAFKQDPEGNLADFFLSMPALADRFSEASREGPVKGSGSIPGYQRIPYGNGWALVGDASQIMDPWSGQGIDQAATHAGFLAEVLHDWLSGQSSWEDAMKHYEDRRSRFSDKTFERTCGAAADFRPMTRAALVKRGLVKP